MNKAKPITKPVTDVPVSLSASGDFSGRLYYNDGANTVFIGINNTVAASGANKGYPLAAGKEFFDNSKNETWAVCAAGMASSIIVFGVGMS